MRYLYGHIIMIFLLALLFAGCKKEFSGLSTKANEIFWITNNGADMPVRVMGNTASKIII